MNKYYLLILFISLSGFSSDLKSNFLIFGDSGYHHSFPKPEEKDGLTLEEFKKEAIKNGEIIDNKPVIFPLILNSFKKGHYFEEGGAFRVGNAMASFCKNNVCEFSLMVGDNIYPNGAQGDADDEKRFRTLIYLPFKNIEKKNKDFRFYVVLGNHDWNSRELGVYSQMEFYARPGSRFVLNPESTDPKRNTYYKFLRNDGDVEFFALDTTKIIAGLPVKDYKNPEKLQINYNPTSKEEVEEQINWLENSLKNSNAKWKIVFGHHPIYSVGGTKWQEAISLREKILPILCKYADIYMSGHEHDLEYHMAPCKNLPDLEILISGAASKQRSVDVNPSSKRLIKEQAREFKFGQGMIWGFAHMSIKGDLAEVKLLQVSKESKYKTIFTRKFERRFKPPKKK